MATAKNYFAWQQGLVRPYLGNRVIEVGCGIGNFTRSLLDREAVFALDVEPLCVQAVRDRYPDARNLNVLVSEPSAKSFADLRFENPNTCVCINVLEHIDDDQGALTAMAGVLPLGGRIVLIVPAFRALYGPIDHQLGHNRRYRPGRLRHLARQAGMQVEVMRFWNLIGYFGWWWNARIARRQAQSAAQIEFFDRAVVPLASRIERVIRPPFGQSIFSVFRKPD